MVLLWSPPGTPDDRCAGVEAFQAMRPPESAWFVLVNQVVFGSFVGLQVAIAGAWVMWRKEPFLARRGIFIHLIYILNTMVLAIPIALKRMIVQPITQQPFMYCFSLNGLYMLTLAVLGSWSTVRILGLIHRARATKAAVHLERLSSDDGDSQDSVRHTKSGSDFGSAVRSFCGDTVRTWRIIWQIVFHAAACGKSNEKQTDHQSLQKHFEDSLRLANESNTTKALCITLITFCVPTLVFFLIFVAFIPSWQSADCKGCDLSLESLIMFMLSYMSMLALRLLLVRQVEKEPDPDNITVDMRRAAAGFVVLTTVFWILIGVDPGMLDYNYIVSWEWLLLVNSLVGCYFNTLKPLLLLAREKLSVRLRSLPPLPDVESSLSSYVIMARFEEFAARAYCIELVRFIQDVNVYTFLYYDRSTCWRKVQASKIAERYIVQGAIMQINVSDDIRLSVEQALDSENVPQEIFDAALQDTFHLIKYNTQLWRAFVSQGGCDLPDADNNTPMRRKASKITQRSRSNSKSAEPSPFASSDGRKRPVQSDISPFALPSPRDTSRRMSKTSTSGGDISPFTQPGHLSKTSTTMSSMELP